MRFASTAAWTAVCGGGPFTETVIWGWDALGRSSERSTTWGWMCFVAGFRSAWASGQATPGTILTINPQPFLWASPVCEFVYIILIATL